MILPNEVTPLMPTRTPAPRPTPELRNKLFGRVGTTMPPPRRLLDLTLLNLGTHEVHVLAWSPMVDLFHAWTLAGLIQHVQTVDRVWAPNFSPDGRPLTHAHGNAFDINSQWNPNHTPGAPVAAPGHIPEGLLAIARRMGWWVGADWRSPARKHFELTVLK